MPLSLAALPRFGPASFWLTIAVAATSAFVADTPLAGSLLVGPSFLGERALWEPLTAPFLFPDGKLGGLIATALLQWLVGSPVEARLGARRYLGLALGGAILGYLTLGLLGLAVPAALASAQGGSAPVDVAVLAAFGVLLAREPVSIFGVLPLTARSFAGAAAGLLLVGQLAREGWPGLVPCVVAGACGLLLARRWQSGRGSGKVAPPGRRPRHLRIVGGREHYIH